jgi:hypothetical protein
MNAIPADRQHGDYQPVCPEGYDHHLSIMYSVKQGQQYVHLGECPVHGLVELGIGDMAEPA